MTQIRYSLEQQVNQLQDTVNNHRSYIASIERLVEESKRPKEVLADVRARLPALEAALKTMKWMLAHEAELKEFFANRKAS